uniref:Acyl-CoA dehydrogenase 6 n=1 Tax=Plectus sambesii TaxID=2011161 RepID=A0A914VYK2_9BILA
MAALSARLVRPLLGCTRPSAVASFSSAAPEDDVIYNAKHWEFRDAVRKVIDKEINPFVNQWEQEKQFPAHQVFKKLGDIGVFGVNKSTEYGGLGLDFSYSVAVAEEMGRIDCGGIPMAIAVQSDMATPALSTFGSDYLKRTFLEPTIAGDMVVCLGVSEPQAGSDVAGIQTTAKREGDDLIINGGKMWITNGAQADYMCLLANTSTNAKPHVNKSLICVPMKEPGVHVSRKIEKLGMHSSDTAQIFFENVRVPAKNIIGDEGMGFTYQMIQFQDERMIGTALALDPLDRIIRLTIEYTKERKVFGRPVLDNQVVHYRLAELQTEVEAVRALLYRAVFQKLQGRDVTLLASMAKLKVGRLAREATDACLQYWGGMGFTWECPVTRFHRDFRLLSIGAGADEVMLSIICKYMRTLPKQ